MLGEPTYQDEDHRIPLKEGKVPKGPNEWLQILDMDFDDIDPDEMIHIIKLLQTGEIPQYASGGRIGFSEGKGPKMSRRGFLKTAAGLASIPFFGVDSLFDFVCFVTFFGCGAGFASTAFGCGAVLAGGVGFALIGVSSTRPFGAS